MTAWDDFLKIGPIVISALILIVAVFSLYKNYKIKKLGYNILTNTSITPQNEVRRKIRLFYEDSPDNLIPINDGRLLIIKFFNDGNVAIEPDHFKQPLTITFDPEVRIIDKEVIDYPDSLKKPELNLSENTLSLESILFNKNDSVTIKILLANSKTTPDIKPRARITDVSNINEAKQKKSLTIMTFVLIQSSVFLFVMIVLQFITESSIRLYILVIFFMISITIHLFRIHKSPWA
jgi:hypothetical protein